MPKIEKVPQITANLSLTTTRDCYENKIKQWETALRGEVNAAVRLLPRGDPRLVLWVVCLAQAVALVDAAIVLVALPSIQNSFQLGTENLTWIVNAYVLPFGGFLLLGGRLTDLFGCRPVLFTGVTLFSVASLVCGLASSAAVMIPARAVQGAGGALLIPAGLAILTTIFNDGPARQKALGIWGAVRGAAASLGLLLGGALVGLLNWRYIFFVNLPICVLIIVGTVALVPHERNQSPHSMDLSGAVTSTGSASALVYAVINAEDHGWGNPVTIGAGAAALTFATFFVAVERSHRTPLLRLGLFRNRTLSAGNLAILFVSGPTVVISYFTSLYFQEVLRYSPLEIGFVFLPAATSSLIGSLTARQLMGRMDMRFAILGALSLIVAGGVRLVTIAPDSSYADTFLPGMILIFFGWGYTSVLLMVLATTNVSESENGVASGLVSTTIQIGGATWLAVLSSLAGSTASHQPVGADAAAMVESYRVAACGSTLLALTGAAVVIALLRRRYFTPP